MKLAIWQCDPANGQIESVFQGLERQLRAAAAAGAEMLVAPELLLPGYNRPDLHGALAQAQDGPWMARLRGLAADTGCGICLGWAERDGDRVHNAASAIGADGSLLAHYRKIQLYGAVEQASFQRGDRLCPVFPLGGFRAAILVCYDIEFPGHAAALAAQGAQLILVPTANPKGFEHVQHALVPARAHENRAVVAYANYAGTEAGLHFGGLSLIAGPDGRALASAGAWGEALLVVDLACLPRIPAEGWAAEKGEYRPAGG